MKILRDNKIKVIVINNSPLDTIKNLKDECFYYRYFKKNIGIASAQNIGIKVALKNSAKIISFFDQDSQITSLMIRTIIKNLNSMKKSIYVPEYLDTINNNFSYYRLNKLGLRTKVKKSSSPYNVDVVISSGMFVPYKVFNVVGLMKDSFFIDYVDTEWCLRCKYFNIPIFVLPKAKMKHKIGISSKKILNKKITFHDEDRYFYQIRNSLFLFRYNYIPKYFALLEFLKSLSNALLKLFYSSRRFYLIKKILLALALGLLNRGHQKKCNERVSNM